LKNPIFLHQIAPCEKEKVYARDYMLSKEKIADKNSPLLPVPHQLNTDLKKTICVI
jgi:hypothetical protein